MKRTLRFLTMTGAIVLSLLSANKTEAQVTAITGYYNDSSSTFCNTPAPVSGFGYYGCAGTIQSLDSMTFYINYGDGSDTTYKLPTQNQFTFQVDHTYMITGVFQITITLTNTNMVSTTLTGQVYTVTNTCSDLTGLVWMDDDGDCAYDMGEEYLNGHCIKATNTTTSTVHYGYVDVNGEYHMEVPDGYTYDIELAYNYPSLTPVCPVSGVHTQVVSGGSYVNDFGYECNLAAPNYSVYGWANLFRPGFVRYMSMSAYTDNYCAGFPATVTLELDPLLSYVGTTYGTAPTVSGQTLTWTVTNLSQLNSLHSTMDIYTDPSAVLGTTLCNPLYITYSGGPDNNVNNDTATICREVSNSWDPNDKQVSPMVDAMGTIENGQMLGYLINFQNTGNDTAYDITIVDTLDGDLDVNSFMLTGSSHAVNVTWLDGNIINFRFENIYLPDSNVNEPLSHGFVTYNINAKTGLADGTTINNTAHIYFDANPAIVTNTTLNTIDIPVSVQSLSNGSVVAKVFPNPANNEVIVTTEGKNNFTTTMYDVIGRTVAVSMTNSGKAVINTSSLANGMYILSIKADGKDMTTKINVQH